MKKLYNIFLYPHQNNGGRNVGVSSELDILSKPAVCGVRDNAGEMYVCYQQSCMKPIYLYQLQVGDSGGKMC